MNEFDKINELLDFYSVLLTEKQQEIMNYYYRDNYSLSEIAEILLISKAGVADTIKRSCTIMNQFENKLNLIKKFKKRQAVYHQLKQFSKINTYIMSLEQIDNE